MGEGLGVAGGSEGVAGENAEEGTGGREGQGRGMEEKNSKCSRGGQKGQATSSKGCQFKSHSASSFLASLR